MSIINIKPETVKASVVTLQIQDQKQAKIRWIIDHVDLCLYPGLPLFDIVPQ